MMFMCFNFKVKDMLIIHEPKSIADKPCFVRCFGFAQKNSVSFEGRVVQATSSLISFCIHLPNWKRVNYASEMNKHSHSTRPGVALLLMLYVRATDTVPVRCAPPMRPTRWGVAAIITLMLLLLLLLLDYSWLLFAVRLPSPSSSSSFSRHMSPFHHCRHTPSTSLCHVRLLDCLIWLYTCYLLNVFADVLTTEPGNTISHQCQCHLSFYPQESMSY